MEDRWRAEGGVLIAIRRTAPAAAASAEGEAHSGALLDIDDVAVSFGGLQALDGVSLRVERGTIVGLIGPNGAGKTTLFNVVSGLQRPDRGTVGFRGRDITALAPNRRAELGIGRSFQNLALMKGETVRTNLLGAQFLGAGYREWDPFVRPARWRAQERRLATEADEAAALFGLEHLLDRRVDDLSFGQSRFAELACVLARRPQLMLLDEPTTGLDIKATKRLRRELVALRERGETILLVAHNVGFVMGLCDWVYVLASGRLLAEGPPQQVQADPEVAAVYLGGVGAR